MVLSCALCCQNARVFRAHMFEAAPVPFGRVGGISLLFSSIARSLHGHQTEVLRAIRHSRLGRGWYVMAACAFGQSSSFLCSVSTLPAWTEYFVKHYDLLATTPSTFTISDSHLFWYRKLAAGFMPSCCNPSANE